MFKIRILLYTLDIYNLQTRTVSSGQEKISRSGKIAKNSR